MSLGIAAGGDDGLKSQCSGGAQVQAQRLIPFSLTASRASERRVSDLHHVGPRKYPHNKIKTTKYTFLTFLPRNLYEQLQKQANCYFLCVSVLMLLGEHGVFVGTIRAWSTLGMLGMMMLVSAVAALMDDIERGQLDKRMNRSESVVVDGKGRRPIRWEEVQVGHVLRITKDQEIPADMILLSSSAGKCFVSTSNLDGETNLKGKSPALPERWRSSEDLAGCEGSVLAEAPQKSIYSFTAILTEKGSENDKTLLCIDNLLLRGCYLRNTEWCLGLVVYTGQETRIQMNNVKVPLKLPNMERVINRSMWVAVFAQAVLALMTDIMFLNTRSTFRSLWYLCPGDHTQKVLLPDPLAYFLTFFVLYSNLVPVSLYASMEICNKAFSSFIRQDRGMQCPGLPDAEARSAGLCHELGQVSYVFTDKTGTLTQNDMTLREVFLNDREYDSSATFYNSLDPESDEFKFFECLALCHTAIRVSEGRYESESPDEVALVGFAKRNGWEFMYSSEDGSRAGIELRGALQSYKVLALNKFDAFRKRMSIVVERSDGRRIFLAKGAETAMLSGLEKHRRLQEQFSTFAKKGLRCLATGWLDVTDRAEFLDDWLLKYSEASKAMENREAVIARMAALLEETLLETLYIPGLTAIEDKLQDEVPETIQAVRQAGVKLWVLTGDSLDTAKTIAYSSSVLDDKMAVQEVRTADEMKPWGYNCPGGKAMLITGHALEQIWVVGRQEEFMKRVHTVDVVIACRVSPLQKADLVRLVRHSVTVPGTTPEPVTLAIGDGANDVPMIRAAQVGVGIFGKEGRQAATSADFAISQFKYLQRLLFVHGRWNYKRSAQVVLFTFWRNAVQEALIFGYTLLSGFSGTPAFEDTIRITFNGFCTIPAWGPGIFDKDVNERLALEHPEWYKECREGQDLSPRVMAYRFGHALLSSAFIAWVFVIAQAGLEMNNIGDYWSVCFVFFTVLVINVNARAAFLTSSWNLCCILLQIASFSLYVGFVVAYNELALQTSSKWMYQVPRMVASQPMFWLVVVTALSFQVAQDYFTWWILHGVAPSDQDDEVASSEAQYGDGGTALLSMDALGQQKLWTHQKQYQPMRTSFMLVLVAWVFLALGAIVHRESMEVEHDSVALQYSTNTETTVAAYWGTTVRCIGCGATPRPVKCPASGRCVVKVPKTIKPPILVSYVVAPFWQNFNGYLQDEDRRQFSHFNDTFELIGQSMDRNNIFWPSDLKVLEALDHPHVEEDVLAWMRPSATFTAMKRYGWLQETIHEGDLLAINTTFAAAAINANKAVVLRPVRRLYGPALAMTLFSAAFACVVLSVCTSRCTHRPKRGYVSVNPSLTEEFLPRHMP